MHALLAPATRVRRSNPDISTLEKTRHCYFGLTPFAPRLHSRRGMARPRRGSLLHLFDVAHEVAMTPKTWIWSQALLAFGIGCGSCAGSTTALSNGTDVSNADGAPGGSGASSGGSSGAAGSGAESGLGNPGAGGTGTSTGASGGTAADGGGRSGDGGAQDDGGTSPDGDTVDAGWMCPQLQPQPYSRCTDLLVTHTCSYPAAGACARTSCRCSTQDLVPFWGCQTACDAGSGN
jgi:hypothetical protein